MNGGHHVRGQRRLHQSAALLAYFEIFADERLRRGRAQAHHDFRLQKIQLGVQPRTTRGNFSCVRLFMDAPFAARLPFEVLHRIRDIDFPAIDAGLDKRFVEQFARGTHEGFAGKVFVVTRLFAYEHDCGLTRAFSEHRLGPGFPERAGLAATRGLLEFGNRGPWRNQRSCGFSFVCPCSGAPARFFDEMTLHAWILARQAHLVTLPKAWPVCFNVIGMNWLYTLSVCVSLAVFAGSLRADDPAQKPADGKKTSTEEQDARPKDGRRTNGLTRAEMEKRGEQWKNMTPEERAAKRKEIKERLEKRIAELRSKQTNATLSPQEARELERREQILKRFEQDTNGLPRTEHVKPVLTNAPVEK